MSVTVCDSEQIIRYVRILPIPKSYTFLHRVLTRNPLPSIPENLKRPFPSNTCHNQEFLIRSSFQIQLSKSDSWSFRVIPEFEGYTE